MKKWVIGGAVVFGVWALASAIAARGLAQPSWPWFAGLPPVSTLIAGDVEKGRKFRNLSHWSQYTIPQRMGYLASMSTATRQDRMPPTMYRWIHWQATPTDQDRSEIKDWAKLESKRLLAELRASRKRQP